MAKEKLAIVLLALVVLVVGVAAIAEPASALGCDEGCKTTYRVDGGICALSGVSGPKCCKDAKTEYGPLSCGAESTVRWLRSDQSASFSCQSGSCFCYSVDPCADLTVCKYGKCAVPTATSIPTQTPKPVATPIATARPGMSCDAGCKSLWSNSGGVCSSSGVSGGCGPVAGVTDNKNVLVKWYGSSYSKDFSCSQSGGGSCFCYYTEDCEKNRGTCNYVSGAGYRCSTPTVVVEPGKYCRDGTPVNTCYKDVPPKYCNDKGEVVEDQKCCPESQVLDKYSGRCVAPSQTPAPTKDQCGATDCGLIWKTACQPYQKCVATRGGYYCVDDASCRAAPANTPSSSPISTTGDSSCASAGGTCRFLQCLPRERTIGAMDCGFFSRCCTALITAAPTTTSGTPTSSASKQCEDGTPADTCSATKPKFCSAVTGKLMDYPSKCGCPEGQQVSWYGWGNSCEAAKAAAVKKDKCTEDGTPINECSSTKPRFCSATGRLIDDPKKCGCPDGYEFNRFNPGMCQKSATVRPKTSVCPNTICETGLGGETHANCPQDCPDVISVLTTMTNACDDGTPRGDCSKTQPGKRCTATRRLIPDLQKCPV